MHKLLYLFSLTGIMVACQPQADPYPTSDVGYISPENRIDPDPEFEICGTESDIVQYYNRNKPEDEPAGYRGGPRAIKQYIQKHYPSLKLHHDDSGMLTVRFIINCEGQTGYFELFENDLDFQPTHFNPETRHQLLKISRELKNWRANYMDGTYRDSFMYITYRLENGKITEILP